jgi:thiamine-phosphate pyrophosphorylase
VRFSVRPVKECGAAPVTKRTPIDRFSGIYGIVDLAAGPAPLAQLDALLGAGIRIVQYRAKAGVDREVVRALHARTVALGARLIVNDDFAAALLADGWHAGQEDLAGRDVASLRAALGTRIFGVSCGLPDEARRAESFGADYVGTGPFSVTGSKADAGAAIGAAGVRAVVDATRLPVVAIGGIGPENLAEVARSGAAMAAVISAIASAPEPEAAARDLVRRWARLVEERRRRRRR